MMEFLPTSRQELNRAGWEQLDIIIVSGDAYVDHPSFGGAIIGRFLEVNGYKVGIIPQPDWKKDEDFLRLGKPRLFFGVTSGNMDSMVNHYTAQKKLRSSDAYSPDGKMGLRPNRATLIYSQKLRSLYKDVPIVLGGIEASLRRIPHYDFWSDKLRNSIQFDSKADILVYGMGEKAILEIAQRLDEGKDLNNIRGTVTVSKTIDTENPVELPEFSKQFSKNDFWQQYKIFEQHHRDRVIYQKFAGRYLKHNPPAQPLSQKEMDELYALPFARKPHPMYKGKEITAFKQIQTSITSHRGCFGGCNFCAIWYHQGKTIQSRSTGSILAELMELTQQNYFHGTVSDVGGPTANMYGMYCKLGISETCKRNSCLFPSICPNLFVSHKAQLKMLKKCRELHQVNNLFLASGIRYDLALQDEKYIRELSEHYTGGLLKLAPEHKSNKVLRLMNKPEFELYEKFGKMFGSYSKQIGKKQAIVPYIIVGHPGATIRDTIELAIYLKKNNMKLRQIQEFTPTPMTASTMMYYTERDTEGRKIHVSRGREIHLQKALVQWYEPKNRKLIIEALKKAKRMDLVGFFLGEKKKRR